MRANEDDEAHVVHDVPTLNEKHKMKCSKAKAVDSLGKTRQEKAWFLSGIHEPDDTALKYENGMK